jgi:hypothetical protein
VDGKTGRDPKFKEAFAIRFWQPLSLQHFPPFIRASARTPVFRAL